MVLARSEQVPGRENSVCTNLEVGKSRKEQEARVVEAEGDVSPKSLGKQGGAFRPEKNVIHFVPGSRSRKMAECGFRLCAHTFVLLP